MTKPESRLVWKSIDDIEPSPENSLLYQDREDSALASLVESVKEKGVLEPLVITLDNYIVSGHRRYTAAVRTGLEKVPCRVMDIERESMPREEYLRILREFNRQRSKTFDEIIAECAVDADPEYAHLSLR